MTEQDARSADGSVDTAAEVIRRALAELGIERDEPTPGTFVATLPGERKLTTTCVLQVGGRP